MKRYIKKYGEACAKHAVSTDALTTKAKAKAYRELLAHIAYKLWEAGVHG